MLRRLLSRGRRVPLMRQVARGLGVSAPMQFLPLQRYFELIRHGRSSTLAKRPCGQQGVRPSSSRVPGSRCLWCLIEPAAVRRVVACRLAARSVALVTCRSRPAACRPLRYILGCNGRCVRTRLAGAGSETRTGVSAGLSAVARCRPAVGVDADFSSSRSESWNALVWVVVLRRDMVDSCAMRSALPA